MISQIYFMRRIFVIQGISAGYLDEDGYLADDAYLGDIVFV